MKNFVKVTRQDYELYLASTLKVAGTLMYLENELVGYVEEWDRDEDTIHLDYFIREDILQLKVDIS
jgi:hypothetical protein